MKFYIKKIILWHKDTSIPIRQLDFLPNKINVITGTDQTGKSTIISIFDYCMLSSRAKFSEKVINENIAWYGILIKINGIDILITRKSPDKEKPSNDVYLETTNIIPILPIKNMDTTDAKSILEKLFGIDKDLKVPYGGKQIKKGSKISFRHFLIFNTQSQNLIANQNQYFDFNLHNPSTYKESLDRLFYLAIGGDNPESVLMNDELLKIERELAKLERKNEIMNNHSIDFSEEISQLFILAQEQEIIEHKNYNPADWRTVLEKLVNSYTNPEYSNSFVELDKLNQDRLSILNQIRKIERFNNQYEIYRKNLNHDYDSLKPIEYITRHFEQLIQNSEVNIFLREIKQAFYRIRSENEGRNTLSSNVNYEIKRLKEELQNIDLKINEMPKAIPNYTNEVQKFMLIGEIRAKLQFYTAIHNRVDNKSKIDDLNKDINILKNNLSTNTDDKFLALRNLEELIQKSYDLISTHLGEYKDYKVYFDVKSKKIGLRNRQQIPEIIGSGSNYLFLHIVLFLGLHELFIGLNHSYVPPILFLDQPSQPYWPKDTKEISDTNDKSKLLNYFKLLNTFISTIRTKYDEDFQIILLEHAPQSYWEDDKLEHFHLVEVFENGNALIQNMGSNIITEPDPEDAN